MGLEEFWENGAPVSHFAFLFFYEFYDGVEYEEISHDSHLNRCHGVNGM